jgi:hypothetical protein
MSELAGQTVVVTGGSAGIGLETARRARAEGAGGKVRPLGSTGGATSSVRSCPSGAWSGRLMSRRWPFTS